MEGWEKSLRMGLTHSQGAISGPGERAGNEAGIHFAGHHQCSEIYQSKHLTCIAKIPWATLQSIGVGLRKRQGVQRGHHSHPCNIGGADGLVVHWMAGEGSQESLVSGLSAGWTADVPFPELGAWDHDREIGHPLRSSKFTSKLETLSIPFLLTDFSAGQKRKTEERRLAFVSQLFERTFGEYFPYAPPAQTWNKIQTTDLAGVKGMGR